MSKAAPTTTRAMRLECLKTAAAVVGQLRDGKISVVTTARAFYKFVDDDDNIQNEQPPVDARSEALEREIADLNKKCHGLQTTIGKQAAQIRLLHGRLTSAGLPLPDMRHIHVPVAQEVEARP